MQSWAPNLGAQKLRSLLGIFQFSGEEVFKRVEVLSGGEKNRVALARLTLDPGNFLLLDEPTNHLDLPTREALEDALAGYGGTLLFVSHDRYFINRVATRVVAFEDGRLLSFKGGYDDYLTAIRARESGQSPGKSGSPRRDDLASPGKPRSGDKTSEEKAAASPRKDSVSRVAGSSSGPAEGRQPGASTSPHPSREQKRREAELRNRRHRELRIHKERIAGLEAKIVPFEARLKEIEAALALPDTYKESGRARALGEEKKSLEIELAHLYDAWEEATSELQKEEAERG